MTNGKRNRSAGHKWERQLAESFRLIGFPHVVTTRSESKSRDDQKIDLMNVDEGKNGRFPYNIQAKNSTISLKYMKILSEMPKGEGLNVIIHNQTKKQGTRFITQGQYAILSLEDFMYMVKMIRSYGEAVERGMA